MSKPHDTLFKQLLRVCFEDFLKLFFPDIHAGLDFSRFSAADFLTNEYLVDHARKKKLIADVVVRVAQKGARDYVIIFTENQNRNEHMFMERVFSYYAAVYFRYHRPVIPIVLYTDDSRTPLTEDQRIFTMGFGSHEFLRFECLAVKLKALNAREYIHSNNPAAVALAAKMGYDKRDVARVKLDIFRQLLSLRLDPAKLDTFLKFVDAYTDIESNPRARTAIQELTKSAEYKEVNMLLTMWERKGRQEGAERNKVATARAMLVRKFPLAEISAITGLPLTRVRALASHRRPMRSPAGTSLRAAGRKQKSRTAHKQAERE